jgi:hypothetical protein
MNNTNNEKEAERNELKNERESNNFFQSVLCPFCNSITTMILDHKKIENKKSDWICLVCGHVFEHVKNS